jgi:hypothetical protein
MKKIPTLFDRDWSGDRSRVVPTVNPPCQWVIDGEGVATRKIDGACARVLGGVLYKRRELRQGEPAPAGFELADRDDQTGKTIGWMPVGDGPEDRWFREAFARLETPADGTYELLGPKVQGNPEGLADHILSPHDTASLAFDPQPPRDFEGLRAWMSGKDIEGVVWHHPDGRRAKLKLRDFGLSRG